jgi:hypothetical protein
LKVRDEDSLYELINNQYCVDSRYSNLFGFVQLEYLSTKSFFSFIELMNKVNEMIHSICCSLVEGSPLHGIISCFTQTCGGHICDRGIASLNTKGADNSQDWPLGNVA